MMIDGQLLFVIALVAGCLFYLVPKLIAKAGIGRDKPDCGCGHCAEKRDAPHHSDG